MDFSYLTIGVVVVLLGACLWLWRNREGSIQQGWRRLLARVRLGLGASSRQEVERINAQLTALAHQMEGRVKALENESLLSHQLQEFSRVIDRRLLQLEQAGVLQSSLEGRGYLKASINPSLWSSLYPE